MKNQIIFQVIGIAQMGIDHNLNILWNTVDFDT